MSLHGGELSQVRILRDVASVLAEPNTAARAQRALLATPVFAELCERTTTTPRGAAPTLAPEGSLAAELQAFREFYGLVPNFFPVAFLDDATPLEFAAWLLGYDHDLYHVLCEYETSDHDEVALQSFLCGRSKRVKRPCSRCRSSAHTSTRRSRA